MSDTTLTADDLTRLREVFARVPFVRLLGLELRSAERGAATFTLDVREELTRMEGLLHGGVLASLLDTAAACAVHTMLEPGGRTLTVDLTIHYLRPTTDGRITARAHVLREGRRLVILAVEATDEAGALIATAVTTYVKQN
ncbi:MAG: PaaI family thioesterase [Pyrinomonadaceae bacterium]